MIDQSHIHPMIVHFPIALVIIGFLSDVVALVTKREFFSSAGLYLIVLGSVGTLAAYLSGNMAGDGIEEIGALGAALETHEGAAQLALWTMLIVATLRITLAITKRMKGWMQWVMVGLLAFGVATIARTGYYGGELVFRHAAGVQLSFGSSITESGSDAAVQSTPPSKVDDDD